MKDFKDQNLRPELYSDEQTNREVIVANTLCAGSSMLILITETSYIVYQALQR